jgi:LacI family transcriptional regulator, repressor for deo operon, udp, cdd, tsx, nupC, and nupG
MSRRPATIRQVAAAAKVSVATVSRALENPKVVAPATLNRVQAVIRELGYTPNAQAQMLRTSKTRLVIALVPDIANPFFSEVIRGIEQVAHANRYSVLLGDTQNNPVREQAYADMVTSRQADGLISLVPRLPKEFDRKRIPLVNACEYVPEADVDKVYVDNTAGARAAVDHLLSLGHRAIAFISGPKHSAICVDRQRGYEQALRHAKVRVNRELLAVGDFSVESGMTATQAFLSRKHSFTAVFCANDEMAIGAMQALRGHGLRVPRDVSIIGFDDIRFARYTDPPLTTVAQPKTALGQQAMTALLEKLDSPNRPARAFILHTELVVRASTARCL